MANYISPGVYVTEKKSLFRPVGGVTTANLGIIGFFEKGRDDGTPVYISTADEFRRQFGDIKHISVDEDYFAAPLSVLGWLQNGGYRTYVLRIVPSDAKLAEYIFENSGYDYWKVKAANKGSWGNRVKVSIVRGNVVYIINSEIVGTGDGVADTFNVSYFPVVEKSVVVKFVMNGTNVVLTDKNGDGKLYDKSSEAGTINYYTGEIKLNAGYIPTSGNVLVDYRYTNWDIVVYYKERPTDDYFVVEQFTDVVMNNVSHERYALEVINNFSNYIRLELSISEFTEGDDIIILTQEYKNMVLSGGSDGTRPASLTVDDLSNFDKVDEMLMIIAPDYAGQLETNIAIISYCEGGGNEKRLDCFGIISTPKNLTPSEAKDYVLNELKQNSTRAAIYYPWLKVVDPITKRTVVFPPMGYVAGVYARTDATRNVAKAPAGVIDGVLRGVVGVERELKIGDRDILTPARINAIISDPNVGICVYGARTLSLDPEWIYINARRTFQYLEKSLKEGTHWAVFENNNETTWLRLKLQIEAFLLKHFYDGFFAGNSAADSFFVVCDETNNDKNSSKIEVDVGVAINNPGEFILLNFYHKIKS